MSHGSIAQGSQHTEEPDFSIEVDVPENEYVEATIPKIKPVNVPLIEKALPVQDKPVSMEVPSAVSSSAASGIAETIEIPHPHGIFPHIEPYPEISPKQHHFRFKHKTEHTRLINIWKQFDPSITVMLNESGKNNVDMTLMRGDQTVGKIQFLHFDRRDRSIRSKHYVKLYLYQFEDSSLFEKTKQLMINFFQSFANRSHRSSRKSKKRSHRRIRRVTRRKPTKN